jgi:hypothetical protein
MGARVLISETWYKTTDEVYVSAQAVQLSDSHMALEPLGSCKGGLELRAAVECVWLQQIESGFHPTPDMSLPRTN